MQKTNVGWLGKLIGRSFGLMLGDPLGPALAHNSDRGLDSLCNWAYETIRAKRVGD